MYVITRGGIVRGRSNSAASVSTNRLTYFSDGLKGRFNQRRLMNKRHHQMIGFDVIKVSRVGQHILFGKKSNRCSVFVFVNGQRDIEAAARFNETPVAKAVHRELAAIRNPVAIFFQKRLASFENRR